MCWFTKQNGRLRVKSTVREGMTTPIVRWSYTAIRTTTARPTAETAAFSEKAATDIFNTILNQP